jgi:hypothetical protein
MVPKARPRNRQVGRDYVFGLDPEASEGSALLGRHHTPDLLDWEILAQTAQARCGSFGGQTRR